MQSTSQTNKVSKQAVIQTIRQLKMSKVAVIQPTSQTNKKTTNQASSNPKKQKTKN